MKMANNNKRNQVPPPNPQETATKTKMLRTTNFQQKENTQTDEYMTQEDIYLDRLLQDKIKATNLLLKRFPNPDFVTEVHDDDENIHLTDNSSDMDDVPQDAIKTELLQAPAQKNENLDGTILTEKINIEPIASRTRQRLNLNQDQKMNSPKKKKKKKKKK